MVITAGNSALVERFPRSIRNYDSDSQVAYHVEQAAYEAVLAAECALSYVGYVLKGYDAAARISYGTFIQAQTWERWHLLWADYYRAPLSERIANMAPVRELFQR